MAEKRNGKEMGTDMQDVKERHRHLIVSSAPEWEGKRKPARVRMAQICNHILETGELQRADVMRICEVSMPQASIDIRDVMKAAPDLMHYDKSRRCYVLGVAT